MSTPVSPQPPEAEESEQEVDVWNDDGDGNLIALFVLDEIQIAVSSALALHYTKY